MIAVTSYHQCVYNNIKIHRRDDGGWWCYFTTKYNTHTTAERRLFLVKKFKIVPFASINIYRLLNRTLFLCMCMRSISSSSIISTHILSPHFLPLSLSPSITYTHTCMHIHKLQFLLHVCSPPCDV